MFQSTLHNHSFAIAYPPVTRGAINIVPFLTAQNNVMCNRKGERGHKFVIHAPGEQMGIFLESASCDDSSNKGPRGSPVGEEIVRLQWLETRLIVHVLPTAGGYYEETAESQPQESGLVYDT
jgi:hypothetical protein